MSIDKQLLTTNAEKIWEGSVNCDELPDLPEEHLGFLKHPCQAFVTKFEQCTQVDEPGYN